jgi:hypothetical protein
MSEKLELKDFIEKYYHLITVIGVFGALAAFFVKLEGFEYIAFMPMLIFFVLMWELLDSFPEIEVPFKSSIKLLIFEFLMIVLLMAVGWYVLVAYISVYYKPFALIFFLGLYALISVKIIVKVRLFERINERVKGEPYGFIRFVLLLVIVGIVMLLASYSANFVTSLIEGTA